jgi:hypothetical protein
VDEVEQSCKQQAEVATKPYKPGQNKTKFRVKKQVYQGTMKQLLLVKLWYLYLYTVKSFISLSSIAQ